MELKPIPKRYKEILKLIHDRVWLSIEDILPIIPNIKYARRVMGKLTNEKFIKCVRFPIFNKTGPGSNFYSLLKKGYQELFSTTYGFKEHKFVSGTNLLHYYIINSVLTGFLVISHQFADLKSSFLTEKQIRSENNFFRYFFHIEKKYQVNLAYPDFILCLSDGIDKSLFFGEVDTGTEVISSDKRQAKTIQNKFKTFAFFKEHNIFKFFNTHFDYDFEDFTYLHITTGNETRIANLAISCDLSNVLITSAENIYPKNNYENFFKPIWRNVQTNKLQNIIGGVV